MPVLSLIRILIATVALMLITLYFSFNVKNLESAVGYPYLILFTICVLILFLISGRLYEFLRVRKSSLFLLCFLSYFFIKLWMDISNTAIIKQYTVGSTGGVFFGIALGVMVTFLVSDMYLMMYKRSMFGSLLITVLFIVTLILALDIFQFHYTSVRSDLFLISNAKGYYQRAGSILFINFMIDSVLLYLVNAFKDSCSVIFVLISSVIYSMIAGLFMFTCQLLGSNSGFACILIVWVSVFVFLFISNKVGLQENRLGIGIKEILFGWIGKRIFVGSFIVFIVMIFGVTVVLHYYPIDVGKFRIFGFGQGHLSSMDNRIDIIKNNFLVQWGYNPLLGNAQVDTLTTGVGTYAHSLMLSLLSHLGVIGFLLFYGFLLQIYFELIRTRRGPPSFYQDRRFSLFRLLILGLVVALATLTTFYTWLPLWFAVGAFGVSLGASHSEKVGCLN